MISFSPAFVRVLRLAPSHVSMHGPVRMLAGTPEVPATLAVPILMAPVYAAFCSLVLCQMVERPE